MGKRYYVLYTYNHFPMDHVSIVAYTEWCVQYRINNGRKHYLEKQEKNILAKSVLAVILYVHKITAWS